MKLLSILFLVVITLSSCAQGKYGVVKTKAYYVVLAPGNVPVDDRGMAMNYADTVYSIFLESKPRNAPEWKTAWVNGKTYNVLSSVMATPYIAGMQANGEEQVTLSSAKTNQLIQLNLEKKGRQPMPVKYRKQAGRNRILIEGVQNDKKVYLTVDTVAQIRRLQENQ